MRCFCYMTFYIESFEKILSVTNDFLYTNLLIVLLVGCGIYFSIRTKFVQFRLIPDALKSLVEKTGKGKISSFQALMISTASRVGTGNIAGITTAIIIGGAGSVFWMWLMAIIGAASAFVESTLAQIYKVKKGNEFRGGPSYYMQKALGQRWLGIIFSILLIACFAYGFNGLQSYNISSSMEYYVSNYSETIYPFIVATILAVLTGLVIYGGVHRIGFISSVLVPIMALLYIGVGIFITCVNINKIPSMFNDIFSQAFDFQSIIGGFAGSAVLIGIKRGLFSNEAGMGSAPNAAATADVSHPVKQGMVQVVSVFIDTIIICTTTAFIILLSGEDINSGLNGIPFVQRAISNQIGSIGIHFVTMSIFCFAFTSIIGNYCYAESNILFIKDSKLFLNIFRASCVIAVFLGAQADFDTVWDLADVLMGLMAIVNIFTIILLGNKAILALQDYMKQKKEGKDPTFVATDLGIENAEVWK